MSKISLNNIDLDALSDMGHKDLETLTRRLIASRDDLKSQNEQLNKILNTDVSIRTELMPFVATVIEALADAAQVRHVPEIDALIRSVGNNTYIQWSKGVPENLTFPELTPEHNAHAGDAEMVLSSTLNEAINNLTDPHTVMELPTSVEKDINILVEAVHDGLQTAIQNSLKNIGTPLPERQEIKIESISDVGNALANIIQNLDFGMNVLRKDLRATHYRSIFRDIQAIASGSCQLARAENKANSGPF